MHLDPRYGFLLPYQIAPVAQREIIECSTSMKMDIGRASNPTLPVWQSVPIRMRRQMPVDGVYSNRLNTNIEWEWVSTPVTEIVRAELDRLSWLYRQFMRVIVLVQKIGVDLPLHRDLIPGNQYDGTPAKFSWFRRAKPNDWHERQRHLTIKIPLTEIEGDNGTPIVEVDDTVYRYEVGRQFFVINEVAIQHGSRPANHLRGVIFIDGDLDPDLLDSLPRQPIPLVLA